MHLERDLFQENNLCKLGGRQAPNLQGSSVKPCSSKGSH